MVCLPSCELGFEALATGMVSELKIRRGTTPEYVSKEEFFAILSHFGK